MKVAICQIDTRVADIRGNAARIAAAAEAARRRGADVAVFPEMALWGYPPRDLVWREDLREEARRVERALARGTRGSATAIVLGTVRETAIHRGGRPMLHNVAVVLESGRTRAVRAKTLLPSYDVFDEVRWFLPALDQQPVGLAGHRAGLLLCEDLWDDEGSYDVHPPRTLKSAGAEVLIALNASPWRKGVAGARLARARRAGLPLVYVNAVGGEDGLVFDGGSFVTDARGEVVCALPRFEEVVEVVDLAPLLDAPGAAGATGEHSAALGPIAAPLPPEQAMLSALVLGTRDFVRKNGLGHAFLGLSGGVDSALVACVAREALGPERVTGIAMPSRFSDPRSLESARALAANLGIGFEVLPLEALHAAAEATLASVLGSEGEGGTAAENVQARLRAMLLLAYVNRRGGVVLNTSNKTELALGYGTLYGDMAGGLAVLGDVLKTEVYALARWYDRTHGGAIPPFILERPPSAELRPEQVDPFDYGTIDPLVEALVDGTSPRKLVAGGAPAPEVLRVARLVRASEHKRRQAPPTIKVSSTAFGPGRIIPITQGPLLMSLPSAAPSTTDEALSPESDSAPSRPTTSQRTAKRRRMRSASA